MRYPMRCANSAPRRSEARARRSLPSGLSTLWRLGTALVAAILALGGPVALAGQDYRPTPENLAARQWYQDAKFGMFIHWGISSQLEAGEWVMENRGITAADYERIAPQWNPARFDPAAWVGTAKAAGMKYITLITKHHDGFALWDSKVSDWDVVDRTAYRRDIVKALADECARQGIKLFFYYSQLDWHHPDYYPRGRTGNAAGRPDAGTWTRYLDYMDAQLTELLTGYGPIGGIWFDGMWDRPDADWRLRNTYDLIHRLQPAALIIPNHHLAPIPGEDAQTFEKDLPGANTAGFNTTTVGELPLETSQTMSDSWGFSITDRNWKSTTRLVGELVEAAGRNANFLLNVGPMPDGSLPPQAVKTLGEIGRWFEVYGRSVSGTRGGPIPPRPWGVTTQRGDTVYLHLLRWSDRVLGIPRLDRAVRRATRLADGKPVTVQEAAAGLLLSLPPLTGEVIDEVIVLELAPARAR
ncbi:MAG: alpha-L-fucosidase [Gemmatimonadales bacterium]